MSKRGSDQVATVLTMTVFNAANVRSATNPRKRGDVLPARALRGIYALDDFEVAAQKHLPAPIFAYVSGGCENNWSRDKNRSAFDDYAWLPHVLNNVSARNPAVTLFGHQYALPFGIAPMGISALSAYRGDIVQAEAACAANIPMVMSGSSLTPMEEITKVNPDAWFQAYLPGNVESIEALLNRVQVAGFKTLMVTVDTSVSGNRENNLRANFSTPLRPSPSLAWQGITHPKWLMGTALRTLMKYGMPHFENSYATRGAAILSANVLRDFSARDHLNWEHLKLIRSHWTGKLVVKGILHPADAQAAQDLGVDGVVLSNHGGRQLDKSVSPLQALPAVLARVGNDYPVMIDGGIRRGNDVLMAYALGAKFVFVGRPFNYAGAIAGQAGVAHAIDLLGAEVHRNMALLGVNQLSELNKGFLI